MKISEFLKANGWKREDYGCSFIDAANDRQVDVSGDNGYVWELRYFSDSDNADGVAVGHWLDATAGDTLAELRHVLGMRPADVYAYDAAKYDEYADARL
jgi:hypothetical protein